MIQRWEPVAMAKQGCAGEARGPRQRCTRWSASQILRVHGVLQSCLGRRRLRCRPRRRVLRRNLPSPSRKGRRPLPTPSGERCRYIKWADLLRLTFGPIVNQCPTCGGRMKLRARPVTLKASRASCATKACGCPHGPSFCVCAVIPSLRDQPDHSSFEAAF
jgi:hypothetical protein